MIRAKYRKLMLITDQFRGFGPMKMAKLLAWQVFVSKSSISVVRATMIDGQLTCKAQLCGKVSFINKYKSFLISSGICGEMLCIYK